MANRIESQPLSDAGPAKLFLILRLITSIGEVPTIDLSSIAHPKIINTADRFAQILTRIGQEAHHSEKTISELINANREEIEFLKDTYRKAWDEHATEELITSVQRINQ